MFKRKNLFTAGLILITLYFIFEGLSNIVGFQDGALAFDRKLYNMEAHFINNYPSISFQFRSYLPLQTLRGEPSSTDLSKLVIILYGAAILVLGCLSFFYEDRKMRSLFVQLLFLLQIFDAMVLHQPLVEDRHLDTFGCEVTHCALTVAICFSLMMVVGQRLDI